MFYFSFVLNQISLILIKVMVHTTTSISRRHGGAEWTDTRGPPSGSLEGAVLVASELCWWPWTWRRRGRLPWRHRGDVGVGPRTAPVAARVAKARVEPWRARSPWHAGVAFAMTLQPWSPSAQESRGRRSTWWWWTVEQARPFSRKNIVVW
jgi:hypothetical protein